SRFAAEVRRGRPVEALAIAEDARHDLVRQLAPLVVKQYSPEDIERTAATAIAVLASAMKRSEDVLTSLARVAPAVGLVGTTLGLITFAVLASAMKRSEDVLTSLARVAPAVGLVGTTLGLISLLRDLSNFAQLGPSMALALLCTLYGLVLANAVYQPLARLVHAHSLVAAEEAKLLTRSLERLAASISGSSQKAPLEGLREQIDELVARTPALRDRVTARQDAEGLGIELKDALLFDSGSAEVRADGRRAIAEVAGLLASLPD